jgi:hypothetical protein
LIFGVDFRWLPVASLGQAEESTMSLQFLITAFVVVLTPGTGVIYSLAIGLGRGRAAAILAASAARLAPERA